MPVGSRKVFALLLWVHGTQSQIPPLEAFGLDLSFDSTNFVWPFTFIVFDLPIAQSNRTVAGTASKAKRLLIGWTTPSVLVKSLRRAFALSAASPSQFSAVCRHRHS
jgi:hypothetical protein